MAFSFPTMADPVGICVAFDDVTLEPAPTWTRLDAKDNLVASYTIDRGRTFELDRTEAGTATITINDVDGDLDPTNAAGPFFGKLEPLLQVAIALYDPIAASSQTIFRGYIEDYDYSLDPSKVVSTLTIQCVDAFAILSAIEMQPGQFGDTPPAATVGNVFFDVEHVDDRISRILGFAGWPTALSIVFTGNVDVQKTVYSPGDSALQAIQDAVDAEFPGVSNFYVSRDGKVTFHGRGAKFDPVTVSAGAGGAWPWQHWKAGDGTAVDASPTDTAQIRPPFTWNRGLSKIINSALATPNGISPIDIPGQLVTDLTSQGQYGIRSWSGENLITETGTTTGNNAKVETKLFAQYYVDNYATPQNRISQLTFLSLDPANDVRNATTWQLLAGAEISDEIDVQISFPGGGEIAGSFFIEGLHYDVRPLNGQYHFVTLTLDVSPVEYFGTDPF